MKKILIIGVLVLFIGASVIPGISRNIEREKIDDENIPPFIETIVNGNDDLLDQHKDIHDEYQVLCHEYYYAQSFIPSFSKLTRVRLYMHQKNNPEDGLHFYVLGEFDGTPFVHLPKPSSELPEHRENADWVEFDFPDIGVTIGETYYIVLLTNTPCVYAYHPYVWWMGTSDPYPDGEQWVWDSSEERWIIRHPTRDMAFQTYGIPFSKSLVFGKIYDLNAEGDYVTCNAVKVRVIQFSPFSFNTYQSDERIIIEKPYQGLVARGIIFMSGEVAII